MLSKSTVRVLCVEDDKDSCELITFILSQKEYEVISAQSLEKAFELIKNEEFALYILDDWLPDGNGTDLCRKIREFDKTTPIIFYSGAARTVDIETAVEAGANEYLVKPNGWDNLLETVTRLITSRAEQFSVNYVTV
jgi:DNA-binding response OmpR family regulator